MVNFGESIGVRFKNLGLIQRAFTHSSVARGSCNQLLEFLGDATIGLAVSDLLVMTRPTLSRHELLQSRATVVNNDLLCMMAGQLGLPPLIRANFSGEFPQKLQADAFEAFVGALLLDQSFVHVVMFCRWCLFFHLDSTEAAELLKFKQAHHLLTMLTSGRVSYLQVLPHSSSSSFLQLLSHSGHSSPVVWKSLVRRTTGNSRPGRFCAEKSSEKVKGPPRRTP